MCTPSNGTIGLVGATRRLIGALLHTTLLVLTWSSNAFAGAGLPTPPICSSIDVNSVTNSEFCRIELQSGETERHDVILSLAATTSPSYIAGYRIETDNFNGDYLPPVVELKPGDALKVKFLNALVPPFQGQGHTHSSVTNLHTHGLIVSANNAHSTARGDGDNIFLSHRRGSAFDYVIRIRAHFPQVCLMADPES
jgi:FtsP/CotA-like multicopper oxidase with cupredoxin domain